MLLEVLKSAERLNAGALTQRPTVEGTGLNFPIMTAISPSLQNKLFMECLPQIYKFLARMYLSKAATKVLTIQLGSIRCKHTVRW